MIPDHDTDDYQSCRVLVMGLGSFGGGLGAVKFFVTRGALVTVTDLRPPEKLSESLAELKDWPPDRLVLGHHDRSDFQMADLIVVNPAVRRDCPFLQAAIEARVPMTSEMNLFWKWNRAPVVAVTGSNGKSTTTALIHAILQQHWQRLGRRAWLGGNIGTSLLPVVDQISSGDIVVLELSSFQLTDLDRLQVSPHIAVVTNFSPNHLDWHPSLEHYRWSKQTLLRWQTARDFAVLNADDADVTTWTTFGQRREFGSHDSPNNVVYFDGAHVIVRQGDSKQEWPVQDWLKLPGRHNLMNALAAITACVAAGADQQSVQAGLEQFEPLPHRLQFVAEIAGRRFYNDSLATTPESTEVALAAFERPIVLLAGGYDKHVDLSRMAQAIAVRAKAVSLMGQTAATLQKLITSHSSRICEVSNPHQSFKEAFDWAMKHSAPGDVVVLSPGCASYDWFRNFADRGTQFMELVQSDKEQD